MAIRRNSREAIKEMLSSIEANVLLCLDNQALGAGNPVQLEVSQIGQLIGVKDKDDITRALYTLEGKALVEPVPAGDFTSNQWKVTTVGMRASNLLKPEHKKVA